jgi:hypothetical protein
LALNQSCIKMWNFSKFILKRHDVFVQKIYFELLLNNGIQICFPSNDVRFFLSFSVINFKPLKKNSWINFHFDKVWKIKHMLLNLNLENDFDTNMIYRIIKYLFMGMSCGSWLAKTLNGFQGDQGLNQCWLFLIFKNYWVQV